MRPITLLALLFLFKLNISAQQSDLTFDNEKIPVFRGGNSDLISYLSDSIRYPSYAAQEFIEGKVVLKFLISDSGHISNVKVIKPVHPSLDSEAVRVVRSMPPWYPAMVGNKAIPFVFNLPISFDLGLKTPELELEWSDNKGLPASELPKFPGGKAELKRFVYKTMRYPELAWNANVQGKVRVNFFIHTDGSIEIIDANNIGWGMTEEAVRIVKQMPRWEEGNQNGIPGKVNATLTVPFYSNK